MKDILLPVAHVFALVMMVFAATMLAPLILAIWGLDEALQSFIISALATFVLGALLWLATRRFKRELKTRDGLMLVALTWVALPAVAGFPLWNYLPINFTDAYFEAASGLTTTGGTVLSGLEFLPRSINLWRHLLSWLGGMGIIVLAVAILPMLGVGGMQIYRAEMPGPMKDSKLTPRIGANREAAVGGVYRTDRGLHRLLEIRRDELVRCGVPRIFRACRSAASPPMTPASATSIRCRSRWC